jgi:hypothetical protein
MRAIRSGRPRSGGVLARNFSDHRSRCLPVLQRAALVSMLEGTQEGANLCDPVGQRRIPPLRVGRCKRGEERRAPQGALTLCEVRRCAVI